MNHSGCRRGRHRHQDQLAEEPSAFCTISFPPPHCPFEEHLISLHLSLWAQKGIQKIQIQIQTCLIEVDRSQTIWAQVSCYFLLLFPSCILGLYRNGVFTADFSGSLPPQDSDSLTHSSNRANECHRGPKRCSQGFFFHPIFPQILIEHFLCARDILISGLVEFMSYRRRETIKEARYLQMAMRSVKKINRKGAKG